MIKELVNIVLLQGTDDEMLAWSLKHSQNYSSSIMPTLNRPKSRGFIKLRTSDPQDHPSTYSTKVIHPSIREGVVGGTFLKTIFSQKILGLKTNEASINSTFLEKYFFKSFLLLVVDISTFC